MMEKTGVRRLPSRLDMSGRRVLITGAASGMGRACASVLAELGASLVLADLNPMDDTCADVEALGVDVQCLQGNLAEDSYVEQLIANGPYFSLAHCAAIFKAPASMKDGADFDYIMRINVRASFRLASGCIAGMAGQGEGYVVMVGSAAGRHGGIMIENSDAQYAEYAASKGGLHTLVKWLSRRAVGKNVLVNGIAPGLVVTPLNTGLFEFTPENFYMPLGRPGHPADLAWPISLMCTPAASYISGVILDVNGGAYVA